MKDNNQRILVVLTNHDTLGASGKPTGLWLPEFTHFYEVVTAAGMTVQLASPRGGSIPIDPASLKNVDAKYIKTLKQSLPISEVDPTYYSAIYFPGGHGPMWDLANDQPTAQVTRGIYEQGGVVSAVCHGPAALLSVILSDGTHLLSQHIVAGFTNLEEVLSMKKKWMPFLLETELKKFAKKYTKGLPWLTHCEVSGRVITGQNPASAKLVGEELVKLIT